MTDSLLGSGEDGTTSRIERRDTASWVYLRCARTKETSWSRLQVFRRQFLEEENEDTAHCDPYPVVEMLSGV